MKYPKVLIINQQSMNKNNATGITLRSLWEGWPTQSVLELYIDNYETHIATPSHIRSICIPPRIIDKMAHGKTAAKVNKEIKQVETQDVSIKSQIRQALVLLLDMFPILFTNKVKKEILRFQPDIVYSLGASVNTLRIANRISRKYDIPIVIHYMDNWIESLQWENNRLIKPYRIALNRIHKKCLSMSKVGLAISPQMANAYKKKMHMPFVSIMNSVDTEYFAMDSKNHGDAIIFVYAGGLHLERWKALRDIALTIEKSKINGELRIFTDEKKAEQVKNQFPTNTKFYKPVDHSCIVSVYSQADVLVHTEVKNESLSGFYKYSISTKIPEYLATGKPIIFYGPKEMGLYRYLNENNIALTASSLDDLNNCIELLSDKSRINLMCNNAKEIAQLFHDNKRNRKKLKKVIDKSIEYKSR